MEFNKQIFNSLEDAIFIFSQDLQVIECNSSFAKLFKTSELSFPVTFIEINRNLDFQNFLKVSVLQKRLHRLAEFSFDTIRTPLTHYYDISCTPLENSAFYICIFHDITEKKITEQIKEDFISNFSHEIKTPLTVLHGHIQILKNDIGEPSGKNDKLISVIQKIEFNSSRMINLFNDMLLLSSVEKKSEIQKDIVEIEDNIVFLAQDLLVTYPGKHVNFIFEIKQKSFFVDLPFFEQILINLIDNSLKYGAAEMNIVISTYQENDYDVLVVEDSGPGIPDNQLHRIFERFYRGEIAHSPASKGTGLGLAIVKHIVQKHEAKIHVSSILNSGTKFILHFKKSTGPVYS
jgi:two-component system phosphate regulon sensor histidine kinase PhoR